ncbi:restriction endonuclease subunit S [Nodularia spumigena]|uniref:Type-1 restriction enzyme EcoKI specificity protein n=1 Tax=Nodularia spumigena UHCC 0039 TaxID=1914872 RepID=A0A2S0Q6M6_NODSP|nr:restriction endonuclease subunit S [Nodularia spumigena]AVZ30054.1 type-1 restriction enzyme EcoKI specificity protein [Nodularia spumigena UHCC 0039]
MKRYPQYKDSGVDWLGDIPEHWEIIPLGYIVKKIGSGVTPKGGGQVYQDKGIPLLRSQNIHFDGLRLDDVAFISEEIHESMTNSKVLPKDILLNITGASIGRVCLVPESFGQANVNQHVCIIRPKNNNICKYLSYFLASGFIQSVIQMSQNGSSREGLNYSQIKCFPVLICQNQEQKKIACFLDSKLEEIDKFISNKQRLIELLKEQKTAIINRAVTKGLNPDAPMKPSGIEWLGDIPAHWEVIPLSSVTNFISYGFTNPMPVADEGPFMLTAHDIGDGYIRFETARKTTIKAFINDLTNKSRPLTNDILITKDGTLGRVALFDSNEACINQSVALLRIKKSAISIQFIFNLLRTYSYQETMKFDAGGTTIKHIYISRLIKMKLAVPPTQEEQARIAHEIQKVGNQINQAITKIEKEIELIKEYRTTLISEAVTGKIDVRET